MKTLILGTSITYGVGASSTSKRWADVFPSKVRALAPTEPAPTVVNAGISGNNSGQMFARLADLLDRHNPDVALLETSINDSRLDLNISTAQSVRNLRRMVALCRVDGIRPIVATAAPVNVGQWINAKGTANYGQQSAVKARATNSAVRAAMVADGVELVDLEAAFAGRKLHLADGIHPNDTGHDAWATAWARGFAGNAVGVVSSPADTPSALFADTFDRADASTLGSSWLSPYAGSWGIANNRARTLADRDDDRVARNVHATDHTISATGTAAVAGQKYAIGLMTRVLDGANYYVGQVYVNANGTGVANFYLRSRGGYALLRSANLIGLDATTDLSVSSCGSRHTVTVNGDPVIQLINGANLTGTGVGMRAPNPTVLGSSRWNSLTVTTP